MKRIGYLYDKICDLDYIKLAIKNASKGKTSRRCIRKVLNNIDHYAAVLQEKLINQTLELSPNGYRQLFDSSCRKKRNITIPQFFPDQVIHWLIMMTVQSVISKGMYRYCCGSVPCRGGIDAKAFVETAVNDKKMRYVAKLDIAKFFDNVKPDILLNMFRRKIKDEKMLHLIDMVLKNGGDCLPIGYYTSQWFSNFYLEGLDHYIKEKLKIRYFVRYVDDMVLIDTNKRKLHRAVKSINEYLHAIGLKLEGNWQVWHIDSRPIDFVGFRFYNNKTLLRKKIFFKLCRRIRKIKKTGYITPQQAMSLLSLIGWLSQINGCGWYKSKVYPYAPKNKLRKIVSNYSKSLNKIGGNINV